MVRKIKRKTNFLLARRLVFQLHGGFVACLLQALYLRLQLVDGCGTRVQQLLPVSCEPLILALELGAL